MKHITHTNGAPVVDNTARSLGGASEPVQQHHVANCVRADPAYGRGVHEALARLARLSSRSSELLFNPTQDLL